ncbi:MAG: hypothetical protein CMB80_01620 [Flammeovirgaceae bacterium]|jgi:hypothetical protein|nr:hypothetical protein [Flammeovirgaceae bacterium]|tara:strand:+ start:228 stop:545 length:318 start_codon:yes stop_codon:yes gene_type:complete
MTTEVSNKLDVKELDFLLSLISDTLHIYEYPTSAIFSAVTRCAITGYLYGITNADSPDLTNHSIGVFRQLTTHAQKQPKYDWFAEWSQKLVEAVRARKLTEDKTF